MADLKHTQGEFRIIEEGDANKYLILHKDSNHWLFSILHNGEQGIEEQRANMRLIIASGDLLEALMSIENDDGKIPPKIWEMRNKAIEKALKK